MSDIEMPNQLSLDLDLPEDDGESVFGLTPEEIQTRKDVARGMIDSGKFFEKDNEGEEIYPFWFDNYLRFCDSGYPFRVAVLMAWIGTPKSKRYPKTKKKLADLLGLSSPRQFSVWMMKNPQIEIQANLAWKERILDGLSDSVDAMLSVAASNDYKGNKDRALHFKMANVLVERIEIANPNADLSKLTYEQKLKLAGLDDPQKLEEFRQEISEDVEVRESSEDVEVRESSEEVDDGA